MRTIPFLKRNHRKPRHAWEASLVWFRLRYTDGHALTRTLRRLSRHDACGRVALHFHHSPTLPALYIALPALHAGLLKQMATDFQFQLSRAADVSIPVTPLQPVPKLSWDASFTAHLVDEHLFVSTTDVTGSYLPLPSSAESAPPWTLPPDPPLGLSSVSNWEPTLTPAYLTAKERTSNTWLLGRNLFWKRLHGGQQLNLYGRQAAVAHWLTQLVIQSLLAERGNLIVIDGTGDLVPQLKRKPIVTAGLGQSIRYIDMNSTTGVVGFNPLAMLPDESAEAHLLRWQAWIHSMGVPLPTVQLLPHAFADGVRDLATLQRWLKQQERQGTQVAIDSLQAVVTRLTRHHPFRDWLEWPTNPYDRLPAGSLLFSCKADGWASEQLLHSVLLAALAMPNVRLICHGMPWHLVSTEQLAAHRQIAVSNAPCLPNSSILISQTHEKGLGRLAHRFQLHGERLLENMRLMTMGEAVLLLDKPLAKGWQPILTRWHPSIQA